MSLVKTLKLARTFFKKKSLEININDIWHTACDIIYYIRWTGKSINTLT